MEDLEFSIPGTMTALLVKPFVTYGSEMIELVQQRLPIVSAQWLRYRMATQRELIVTRQEFHVVQPQSMRQCSISLTFKCEH